MMKFLEFFNRQLLIAKINGIPVRIDYRWFVVVVILSWLMARNISSATVEDAFIRFGFGIITTLIFFASILIHELAHSYAAKFEGVEVRDIVIHPFGGLARFFRPPDNPRSEFRIAIAGPAASFVLAILFSLIMAFANSNDIPALRDVSFFLFFLNLLLAVFNLFPGYPLDGGRVLRAFLWKRGYELNEATILTGRCGQVIALALVAFGLFITFIRGEYFTGLWMVLVGLFLFDSARDIIREVDEAKTTKVEEVMTVPVFVEPESTIQRFVDKTLPMFRQTLFLVAKDRHFFGVLLLDDMKAIPNEDWRKVLIKDIMRPIVPNYFVELSATIEEAKELMRGNGIGAVGVIDEKGNLVGYLERRRIRRSGK